MMNREYLLIDIGLGAEKLEDYDIELTEEDKEAIEWYKRESEKAKREGRHIVFMLQVRISYGKRIIARRRKRTNYIS